MVAWKFIEAKIAVSSEKVAVVVLSDVERSLVYTIYRTGPKTLPCGTPASVFLKIVIPSMNFT
jgi:hypothetical protein